MRKLIGLFLLVCSFSASAQTGKVVGKVRSSDGETLPGASVIVKTDVTIGAETDEQGNYILELPAGRCLLICRFTDMITDTVEVTVIANQTIQQDITLYEYGTDLDEFVLKVGKFDTPIEDQTVSLEVLKPGLIESKNTRSIETALDQVPGLNILDGEPQIRGGSGFTFGVGSKVAIIVDDMPLLSGDAGRPEWGFAPVENIHQVEVTKGAASVLSGSSALSGSIHIRTAYPGDKPVTRVNIYSGMYDRPSNDREAKWWTDVPLIAGTSVLHSRKYNNLDLVLGGNFNYDHGYLGPPMTDSIVTKDTITNFSNKQMASQRARFNFNLRHRSKKFRGMSYGVNGNFMVSHSNLVFAWLNDTNGLYRAYPGAMFLQDQLIFNVDPFFHFFTTANGKHSLRTRMLRTVNELTANQSNQSTVLYGDYQFQKRYASLNGFEFIGGLSGQHTHSYANIYAGSGSPMNNLLNLSAYAQGEKKIRQTVNLSVGGRLEYFQLNDSITALKPIFRAGTSIKLYQETYMRMSYGQGYRFPTITERFIKTGVGNFGVFPNPALKPESSWNAEIGIKQGLKFGKLMGYFDVAAFWQEYENTIEYMFGIWDAASTTSFAGFKFLNTGRSRVLGIDVSFSGVAKISKQMEITFLSGYNYISPKTLNPDYVYATDDLNREFSYESTSLNPESRVLKYRFLHNIKVDAEVVYRKKLAAGFSLKYFSKIVNMDRIIQEFEETTMNMPYIQDIRYMDYFYAHDFGNVVLDARVSYAFNTIHKVALIGTNILNRSYSLRPLKIEPPRTVMLQYTLSL